MNMEVWDKLKQPPDWALKKITGGRLNGKSDISPMWRIQALTEVFGMCGVGWKYELKDKWTQEASGQIMLFVEIALFVKDGEQWSDAILGFGGDFLIEKESSGLHANDEAMKMAVTDALGNAMKNLGVAAVVFSGGTDGTKYNRPATTQSQSNKPPVAPPVESKEPTGISQQAKMMFALSTKAGMTSAGLKTYIKETYQKESSKDLTTQELSRIIDYLQAKTEVNT